MTIPAEHLAGYCCPQPALLFEWALGTEMQDTTSRVVALTNLRCTNCGTRYTFKGSGFLKPEDGGRTIVLMVDVPPELVQ